jgi:hypothetical protein
MGKGHFIEKTDDGRAKSWSFALAKRRTERYCARLLVGTSWVMASLESTDPDVLDLGDLLSRDPRGYPLPFSPLVVFVDRPADAGVLGS